MRILLTAFFLLQVGGLFAQSKFEPGYFMTKGGTRVDCLIRNFDKRKNPDDFQYRLSATDEIKTIVPDSLLSFEILNTVHKYVRHTVKIERSTADEARPVMLSEIVFRDETLFLRQLVNGSASLLMYASDGGVEKFFYQLKGGKPEPLTYYVYLNEEKRMAENTTFKQQLWNTLQCSSLAMNDFENLFYNESQLVKLFVKYNRCKDADFVHKNAKAGRTITRLYLLAGINSATLQTKNTGLSSAPSNGGSGRLATEFSRSSQSLTPVFGLAFRFEPPYNQRRYAFVFEPTFQVNKATLRSLNMSTGAALQQSVTYPHISLPFGLQYALVQNTTAQLNVKATAAYYLVLNPAKVYGTDPYWKAIGLKQEGLNPIPGLNFGFNYTHQNKISIEAFYQLSKMVLNTKNWEARFVNSVNVMAGYKLW